MEPFEIPASKLPEWAELLSALEPRLMDGFHSKEKLGRILKQGRPYRHETLSRDELD